MNLKLVRLTVPLMQVMLKLVLVMPCSTSEMCGCLLILKLLKVVGIDSSMLPLL